MEKEHSNKHIDSILLAGIILMIFSTVVVSAFGVGFENKRIKMFPGEERDYSFILQNYKDGVGTLTIEATIEEGSEYLTFLDRTQFEVPSQTSVLVPVKVSVPASSKVGDVHEMSVLFRTIAGSESSSDVDSEATTIGMVFSNQRTIEIEVVPKPSLATVGENVSGTQTTSSAFSALMWVFVGIIVLIVVVLIILLVMRKKENNRAGMKSSSMR